MTLDDTTTFTFDTVHTPQNPYCTDLTCWCHRESSYHNAVTQPLTSDSDVTVAYSFFGIEPSPEVQAS